MPVRYTITAKLCRMLTTAIAVHRSFPKCPFATKYLHFCSGPGGAEPALILDRLVRSWLGRNAGWYPRLDWRPGDYRRYVDTVLDRADKLDLSPPEVEYLMFAGEATSDRTSQWGQAIFASAPSPAEGTVRATEDSEVGPMSFVSGKHSPGVTREIT